MELSLRHVTPAQRPQAPTTSFPSRDVLTSESVLAIQPQSVAQYHLSPNSFFPGPLRGWEFSFALRRAWTATSVN